MGTSSTQLSRGERTPLLEENIKGDIVMAGKVKLYHIFYNTYTFVALFTISSLALTTSSGYLSSVISTVEQRFQLKSTESSLLFTVDDAVSFSTVLFVTHFGNSVSKPKLISFLFLLVATGTVCQTIPHFLYEPPDSIQPSQGGGGGGGGGRGGNGGGTQLSDQHLCDNSSIVIDNCTSKDIMNSGALWYQVWWLYIGKALAGFGISTNPLAVTYLDDSPLRSHLPIFIAIIYGFRSTGSSLGGFIAQQCLSVPASWPLVTSHTVTNQNDPRYLGAWWLGFIPISVMTFCPTILMFFFPKVMTASSDSENNCDKNSTESDANATRGRGRRRSEKEDTNKSIVSEDTNAFTTQESTSRVQRTINAIIGFFRALLRVMRNWVVLSLIFADHALSFTSFPDGTFAAKYLQYEFQLSAARASALRAWTKLPMIFVGYFFSAFIIMIGRLKPRGTIIMVAVCIACAALMTPVKLFAGCKNNPIAGLSVPYDYIDIEHTNIWNADDRNLTATCNADCYCPSGYNPVCAPSGVSYVTACHAGCADMTTITKGYRNVTVFSKCSCYDELFPTTSKGKNTLIEGICATNCTWIYHFILLMMTSLLRNIMYSPSLMSKVRFVDEQDRSMIQGLDKFIKRFLVTSPGPIVYGILFDKSCMLFQTSCGKTGNCLVYNIELLRKLLFGVATGFASVSLLGAVVTLFLVFLRMKRVSKGSSEVQDNKSESRPPNESLKSERTDSSHQITVVT